MLPTPHTRVLADLKVLANVIPVRGYIHGEKRTSIIANIYFYDIDTPRSNSSWLMKTSCATVALSTTQ
jgi:hypothetical protein